MWLLRLLRLYVFVLSLYLTQLWFIAAISPVSLHLHYTIIYFLLGTSWPMTELLGNFMGPAMEQSDPEDFAVLQFQNFYFLPV